VQNTHRSGSFGRTATAVAGMAWLATSPLAAQQPPAPAPAFEVASVKKSNPKSTAPVNWCLGGPGSQDPELQRCTNSSLANLICLAYNIMWMHDIIAPGWVMMGGADVGYDLTAKVPAGATRDQLRLMMQRLLAERFHLVVHWETKTKDVYTLQLGKKPKLTPSSDTGPGNVTYKIVDGHMLYSMHNKPMSTLINLLVAPLDGQVVDETGLQGNYDLTLEYMPEKNWSAPPPAHPDPSVPNVFTAVVDQLGLKIESKKVAVAVLVVDSADKVPAEN
jgi:uncharacterized protein (TIGR03435 family)